MWKMKYFGLKLGQDLGDRAAHPYQEFRGVPLSRATAPSASTEDTSSKSLLCITQVDCSQSPIFLWDFRDLNASIELPPSLFVRASATWGECLNYRGGPSQVTLSSVKNRGTVTTSY